MIQRNLEFDLPVPWQQRTFSTHEIGPINFLVGPNGAGKSSFAGAVRRVLGPGNARLLGTDRLIGMEQNSRFRQTYGDFFSTGIAKNQFDNVRNIGQEGAGIDAIILLEERLDLRIQVEATLSHLFDRKIRLEWNSGMLVPTMIHGTSGAAYRLDREECHGIKELLVLLTHLYNDQHSYLIIDEPELNLHPQYQAFFMQEVRRMAGDPANDNKKKIIFLITHSPFILDFRSVEDVKSIFSFSLDYSIPRQLSGLDADATARLATLVPRLNVHHKQLFFSDNPIFVEGILDAQLIETMQEARGVSVAGAGSCVIDVGGCEEVTKYLDLCLALGKRAYFVYDLDSLFSGALRACVRADGSVQHFLLTAGVGNDFGQYCGEMERRLTILIDQLLAADPIPPELNRYIEFLRSLGPRAEWDGKRHARARVATLTAISRHRNAVVLITSEAQIGDIEGRLNRMVEALRQINVYLLPGGTLERYLPSYAGDHYELSDDAKKQAVLAEMEHMANPMTEEELAARYGYLYEAVKILPSKQSIDLDRSLKEYLSHFIHDIQGALTGNPAWQLEDLQRHLIATQPGRQVVFRVTELHRGAQREFQAVISISEMLGQGPRLVRISHQTNAGMQEFAIENAPRKNAPAVAPAAA